MEITQQEFHRQCRDKGFKLTPQRWAVYETLMQMTGHPSVEDIYTEVTKKLPSISLNTVYTTLNWLEANGFVFSALIRESAKKYDSTSKPHHHLVCVGCGEIIDFVEAKEIDPVPPGIKKDYRVLGFNITVNVICAQCKNAKAV